MKSSGYLMVRRATEGDVEAICSLFERELLRAANIDSVTRAVSSLPSAVALDGEKLVGFCYLGEFAPDVFEVFNILVDSNYQSRGLGSAMLDRISLESQSEGASGLILSNSSAYGETLQGFRFADSFYRGNGFSLIAETPLTKVFYRDLRADD